MVETPPLQPRATNRKRDERAATEFEDEKQCLEYYNAPADDLVGEEDSLHLRVLDMIAPLVLDHLLGRGVDETDVDVLLLPHACNERKM